MNQRNLWMIAATIAMLTPTATAAFPPPPQDMMTEAVDLAHLAICRYSEEEQGSDMPYVCDAMYGDPVFGTIRPCRMDAVDGACPTARELLSHNETIDAGLILAMRVACRDSHEGRGGDAVPPVCASIYGDPGFGTIRPCREGHWHVAPLRDEPPCTGLVPYLLA